MKSSLPWLVFEAILEAGRTRSEPYTKIVDLVKNAVGEERKAYVLVNNRSSEGNTPLSIPTLRDLLQLTKTRGLAVSIQASPASGN